MSRIPDEAEYQTWRKEFKRRYALSVAGTGGYKLEDMPSFHQQTLDETRRAALSVHGTLPEHLYTPWEKVRRAIAGWARTWALEPKWSFRGEHDDIEPTITLSWRRRLGVWLANKVDVKTIDLVKKLDYGRHQVDVGSASVAQGRGYQDGRNGMRADLNPYPDKSDAFYGWYKGWKSGNADAPGTKAIRS